MRVYECAKELGISSAELMHKLKFMGIRVANTFNAVDDVAKAIEINEELGEAFYIRAYMKLLMKDYQSALTDFTHAIQKGHSKSEAYYYRGLMYFEMNDYNSALIDFTLAIDKNYDFYRANCLKHFPEFEFAGSFDRILTKINKT